MALESDNVEVVRALFAAVNSEGNWLAGVGLVDPEIELETDPRHPSAGVYRGVEKYRAFLEEFEEPYERTRAHPERIFARGEKVITFARVVRRPRGSTVDIESRVGFLWTLRDGRIVREQAFAEREKALAAAGMDEGDAVPE